LGQKTEDDPEVPCQKTICVLKNLPDAEIGYKKLPIDP
jgi:hypothetical protein